MVSGKVKYHKLYQEPIKYRVMTADKWMFADKHDTIEQAIETCLNLKEDGYIVEYFPGINKFPVYGSNVEE